MSTQPDPSTQVTATATAPTAGGFQQEYASAHARAVEVLTGACRLTYSPVRADWSRLLAEPVDFADFLASVLAAVAANLGSTGRVVAGRPGSWEAELVTQLLTGTVGTHDEWLFEHRTEPVVVPVNVLELSWQLPGFPDLEDAVTAALFPLRLHPDPATTERLMQHLTPEQWDAWEQLRQDAEAAVLDAYTPLYAVYADAFTTAVHRAAAEIPGLRVRVRVEWVHDPRDPDEQVATITNPPGDLDPTADLLAVHLWQTAVAAVPVPRAPVVQTPAVPGWLIDFRAQHTIATRPTPPVPSPPTSTPGAESGEEL